MILQSNINGIVCSSSKEGDSFRGAVNSTLFVDELEIVGE